MRITSQMFFDSSVNMYKSETYKKAIQEDQETDETDSSDLESTTIGDDLLLEKDGDTLMLSKIQDDNTKKLIEEISVNSKRGALLNEYLSKETNSNDTNDALSQINYASKVMNLSNYL